MSDTTKIKVYKYKNIAAALAVLLLVTVGISTSCSKRSAGRKETKAKKDTAVSSAAEDTAAADDGSLRLTRNYIYKEMQNGTNLNNGLLLQVDSSHPFTGQVNNAEPLYSFMFDADGEQVLAASYPSDEALPDMLKSLNQLAVDFEDDSGLNTLMVSSLIPEGDNTDEAAIGSSADLMLYDYYNGTFENFTGTEEYAWIPENCHRYGFVMRGTDRLRYVGRDAAECIRYLEQTEGQADLEKLETVIRDYSFEKPLFFTADSDVEYAAYFVAAEEGSTTTSVPVPTREDESEYSHSISGNNEDGYIVIVDLSDNADFDSYYENMDTDSESEGSDEGELL